MAVSGTDRSVGSNSDKGEEPQGVRVHPCFLGACSRLLPLALRPRRVGVVGTVAFAGMDVRVGRDVLLGELQRTPPGWPARGRTGWLAKVEQDAADAGVAAIAFGTLAYYW